MTSLSVQTWCVVCGEPLEVQGRQSRTCDRPQCRLAYQRHLALGKPTCTGCGRPLEDRQVAARQSACDSAACRLQYAQHRCVASASSDHRCSVCNVPLAPHQVVHGLCDDRDCVVVQGAVRMAELREERRVQLQQARDAATKLRDEKGRSEGPDDAETYTVAVVPHMRRPLSPPQAERVDKLREHLEHLVHTAMSQPEAPSDAPYQLSELPADATDVEAVLFSGACRLCRGHCCQTGEEHAFLSVKSIRDYLARVPDATGEDIVEHYVKRVPTYSVVGSCIFHGETGCALPRVMRSDTCNRWLCPGLTDLREALAGGASPRFFIASNGEAGIDAAEFVDATTVTT